MVYIHCIQLPDQRVGLELDGDEATRERFPLPQLEDLLEQCAQEVHRGSGFCIVRGLNPSKYTPEDNIVLFLALASYIGDQRGIQNAKGDVLCRLPTSYHLSMFLLLADSMRSPCYRVQVLDRAERETTRNTHQREFSK